VDAAQSGAIAHSQTNWMETTVTGPGTLSFWWKVSSETNYDYLRFFSNGVQQAQISGEVGWVQTNYVLGAGAQTLRWAYRKDSSVSKGQDAGWVDQVSYTPAPTGVSLTVASANPASGVPITVSPNDNGGNGSGVTVFTRTYNPNTPVALIAPTTAGANVFSKWQRDGVDWATTLSTTLIMDASHTLTAVYQPVPPPTLAEALDTPGWSWTTGGTTPAWYGQTAVTHDGADAARSGAITNSQTNWVETAVSGPGTLTFWWKVSSETNYDFLRFYVGGVQQARISGEVGWAQTNFALAAGVQTLRWAYTKDSSVSKGQDAGWVDQVGWVAGALAPRDQALGQSDAKVGPAISSLKVLPGGQVRLTITGTGGAQCRVLASGNLADWTDIGRATISGEGSCEFTDAAVPRVSIRFYRLVTP
jgi:hypothetical protein